MAIKKFVETEDDPMIKRIAMREVRMLKVCLKICRNYSKSVYFVAGFLLSSCTQCFFSVSRIYDYQYTHIYIRYSISVTIQIMLCQWLELIDMEFLFYNLCTY